jgi:hypothetical protein
MVVVVRAGAVGGRAIVPQQTRAARSTQTAARERALADVARRATE